MKIQLSDLWFVTDNDITSLPDVGYMTQREAECEAERLIKATADFRARILPNSPLPKVLSYLDTWLLVRDNIRHEVTND